MPEDHALEPADMMESTAITIDHAIVTSNTPSTIPTDGSATLELILMLTSRALALVVFTILPEHQLELEESSFLVPSKIIMNPLAKDGSSLAMVPHEGASPQFPNHI
ncbi:unnamed protein product [Prunus brigantina]